MVNSFNLVDENWIPVAGAGMVSLRRIFSDPSLKSLGGNPIQKIAVLKLLLAIAQTAATPQDDEEWLAMGTEGMAKKCLDYLEAKKDCFWLYGDKPFLQMPGIDKAEIKEFGVCLPYVANGNTTLLSQINKEQFLFDSEKALLILMSMGFGLGGGKCDNSIVLSPGYLKKSNEKGKPSTGKPGPSIGFWGYLHNFLLGNNLWDTVWLNLFTNENIDVLKIFPEGLGNPPWEAPPVGEDCLVAKSLQRTLMGRYIPYSRFVLLKSNGIHFSEGVLHGTYNEGVVDPSIAVEYSGKKNKVIWVDPNKRPWRSLSSILTFLETQSNNGFDSIQLRIGINRIRSQPRNFGIWSGGLRASGQTAGEQKVSGDDDFVESEVMLNTKSLGSFLLANLRSEMTTLEDISKMTYGTILGYYKDLKTEGKKIAEQGSNLFWQLCERHFQKLIDYCSEPEAQNILSLRLKFAGIVNQVYNSFCPNDTARQLEAWAKNQPRLGLYLKGESTPIKKDKEKGKSKQIELEGMK